MSTRGGPDKDLQARREAINAKTRETLAGILDRLEKALQRLRAVETQASPATKRLLHRHVQITEEKIAKAASDFLRAEPAPVMQEVYQIIAAQQQRNRTRRCG